jgi:hypothetical protein
MAVRFVVQLSSDGAAASDGNAVKTATTAVLKRAMVSSSWED